ncbi:hypothetical protein C0J52_22974 [Blattella germanica]|nr:hypothetical protein C0J52_22974 [Blattella germanica]
MTNSIEMSPRRNIFFNCRYHSQFVYTDKEYQFVYFSHKIQVLARSRYFKFIPTKPAEKVKKNVHKEPSDKVLSSSIPLIADTFSEKSSSAWIHKLENRNRNLEERIEDLENELQISVLTQKQLRLEAHYSKREKLAYQKFIQGLVNALSQKGIARVIDNKGREMDLVVVPKEYDDVHSNPDNMKSPEHLVDEFAPVVQK